MKIINSMNIGARHLVGLSMILISLVFWSFINYTDQKIQVVVIHTDYGNMTVRLYDETPAHRDNFLKLVTENYYDSLLFHRVIKAFMIQGGDPISRLATPETALGVGGPGYTVPAELNNMFIHKKGALSAARQSDAVNPDKASSGSQFYVVQGNPQTVDKLKAVSSQWRTTNPFAATGYTAEQIAIYEKLGGAPHLDGEYTVFGEVIAGFEVIDSIAAVAVNRSNRPNKDVRMYMTIEKQRWP